MKKLLRSSVVVGVTTFLIIMPGFRLKRAIAQSSIQEQSSELAQRVKDSQFDIEFKEQNIDINQLEEEFKKLRDSGKFEEAIQKANQIVQYKNKYLRENKPVSLARSLYDLAEVYSVQGYYANAEPLYREALNLLRQNIRGTLDEAAILHSLGKLDYLTGRYREAERYYEDSISIVKKGLNIILNSSEEVAVTMLLGGNKEFQNSITDKYANVTNSLAELYSYQGKYQDAVTLYENALNDMTTIYGNKSIEGATISSNLAKVYFLQGRYQEAEKFYLNSLDVLGDNHINSSKVLNNIGELYRQTGQYTKAEQYYQQALVQSKKNYGENYPDIATISTNLAALYQSKNDIFVAINYFTQGIKIQEFNISQNLVAGDEKQKQNYIATISGTTYGVISFNLQSAPDNPQATQLALKTILERKGRVLDVSTNSLQILRQRTDDNESQQLLTQLIDIRTQQSNLTFTSVDKFPSPEIYRQLLTEVQIKAKEIEDKIGRSSAEFRQLSQPITLEAIQQQIPKDSALIEIVRYRPFNPKATQNTERFGRPRYAVYILFPNGEIKAKDLGDAKTIDDDLIYFRDNLRDQQTPIEQVKESSRELDAKLMQPIRELLGNTKTILLSPDGALNLIPFEALVDENNQYLVENYQITYLTSGRDLLRLKEKFASEQPPLILADPIYNKEGEEFALNPPPDQLRSSAFCERGTRNFSRLGGTQEEGKQVKQLFSQATIVTGSQATENVLKQVKRPEILHIATHGFFCPTDNNDRFPQTVENPLLKSGLVLAGVKVSNSAGDDGILTALETTVLNLVGTKLVVLSACDTGRGDITTGEGVYGLKRALVLAGSESQLISLWKVSDDATKDLMIAYYEGLKKGEGRSEALRQIQLEMLKSEAQNHPFYWASFIPSGDWTQMEFDSVK